MAGPISTLAKDVSLTPGSSSRLAQICFYRATGNPQRRTSQVVIVVVSVIAMDRIGELLVVRLSLRDVGG